MMVVRAGALLANRLRTRTSRGVVAEASTLTLTGWDHRGGPGLNASGGEARLTATRMVAEGPSANFGVMLEGVPTTTVTQFLAMGFSQAGISLMDTFRRARFEDVMIDGGTGYGIRARVEGADPAAPRPRLHLARIAAFGVNAGVAVPGVEVVAEDLVLHVGDSAAFEVHPVSPWPTRVELNRLWARSGGVSAVTLGAGDEGPLQADVVGEDWLVGPDADDSAMSVAVRSRALTRVTVRRAHLTAGLHSAYFARCSELHLEDLTVAGGPLSGLWLHAEQPSELTRVRVVGGTDTSVVVAIVVADCPLATITLKDADLVACPKCKLGISVYQGARLAASLTRVRGYDVGVEADLDVGLAVTQSVIEDNKIGLSLAAPSQVNSAVRGVRLANDRNIVIAPR